MAATRQKDAIRPQSPKPVELEAVRDVPSQVPAAAAGPKTATIVLEYQNVIPGPPAPPQALHARACANDTTTVDYWRDIWISQTRENHATVGSFAAHSVGKLYNRWRHRPAVVAGSGPSLAGNGAQLKDRGEIPLVSCLHNFHFFEDRGITPDVYVSLDAGPIVLDELSEGGLLSPDEYWARTAGKTLACFIGSHPDLVRRWRGEVLFFNAVIPDDGIRAAMSAIEPFNLYLGNGGNVLGASTYLAKAVLGCNPIAFVGADFCFDYARVVDGKAKQRFHGWDSQYDKNIGECLPVTDIYGNKRKSWPSYLGFKAWQEYVACTTPGIWFNCSEGGTLGAYPEGNIAQFTYMDLERFLNMYLVNEQIEQHCKTPQAGPPIPLLF